MKHLLLAGWLATFGADATTTNISIAKGNREVWMPSQKPVVIDTLIASEAAAGWWAFKELQKDHPKIAKVVYGAIIGIHVAATVQNARAIRR